jgi:hypothetical protein
LAALFGLEFLICFLLEKLSKTVKNRPLPLPFFTHFPQCLQVIEQYCVEQWSAENCRQLPEFAGIESFARFRLPG